jgi:hypothetical protein
MPNLIEIGSRNKVLPILAEVLARTHADDMPARLGNALRVLSAHEGQRVQCLMREAQQLSRMLNDAGIPHAVRKGPALSHLYKQSSDRPFEDIDLLISAHDASVVQQLLASLGYVDGNFNRFTGKIVRSPREMQIQYRLRPDHLPHQVRRDPESPAQAYILDIAFTSGWHGDDFGIDTLEWLDAAQSVNGLVVLDPARNAIDVTLHLYREAFLVGSVRRSPCCLRSFADVYLAWQALGDQTEAWHLCRDGPMRAAICKTLNLVETVITSLPSTLFIEQAEGLLYTVIRDKHEQRIAVSLLDRMATTSHVEYAQLMAAVSL